jgi:hypothetical protein
VRGIGEALAEGEYPISRGRIAIQTAIMQGAKDRNHLSSDIDTLEVHALGNEL